MTSPQTVDNNKIGSSSALEGNVISSLAANYHQQGVSVWLICATIMHVARCGCAYRGPGKGGYQYIKV